MDIVVFEGTAFWTMLIPSRRALFLNVSFMVVDKFLSVEKIKNKYNKKEISVVTAVGAVGLCKTRKTPENTGKKQSERVVENH